ncbi:hypothetical protein SUGI_0879470 [Cryptomeria japonica]|nr:hypothetical protein SUGI_0879470 [Cryptomeria japonica]
MSRKGSKCVTFSPDTYSAGEKASSSEKGSKSNSSKSKKIKGKSSGRKRNKLCIPKLRSSNMSPMKIIGRFVHALFRSGSSRSGGSCVRNSSSTKCYPGHFSPDSHYSEAIQDCIEFFKKSSTTDQRVS